MNSVKHFTVDSFIDDQKHPEWMRSKMNEVRQLILTFPEITERIRYGVPFYDYRGMMLYFGPYQKSRLVVGFVNGVNMDNTSGVLKNDEGQTQIRHYELFENKKFNEKQFVKYIVEAMSMNDFLEAKKNGNKKSKARGR